MRKLLEAWMKLVRAESVIKGYCFVCYSSLSRDHSKDCLFKTTEDFLKRK